MNYLFFFPLLVASCVSALFFSQIMLSGSVFSLSVGIGVAFGIASVFWLRFVFNDIVVQISVTLSVSYFAYYTVCSLLHTLISNARSLEILLRVF